jgi:hypothetical protein
MFVCNGHTLQPTVVVLTVDKSHRSFKVFVASDMRIWELEHGRTVWVEISRIWELDHGRTIWVEISRMPPRYFRALLRLSAERFECFAQDNLICFTSWNQGKGLLYDVDKKS